MRTSRKYTIENQTDFKQSLLSWAQQFSTLVWLDSNQFPSLYAEYDAILAVEEFTAIKTDYHQAFEQLNEYQQTTKDWIFGYLSYDLKNDTENLTSTNVDGLRFPDLYFFQPQKLFLLKGNQCEVLYLNLCADEIETDWEEIENYKLPETIEANLPDLKSRISKSTYLKQVNQILAHIHRGDIYEVNFCQEFYAENAKINPLTTFEALTEISQTPFASFCKFDELYALSASPERYLKKIGNKIISQPIKGTAPRSEDVNEDNSLLQALLQDEKEKSENVMIVDLVRNDLSKTAEKGSVQVEKLCEPYSFKQVHQLISTVTSTLQEGKTPVDVIQTTFPMGSMTGAPKVSAMQIIEATESTKRGLYSGAIGFFSPQGDFDFNVVIRSILYNQNASFVNYMVGSAITEKSIPEKEFQECLVKAKALQNVLVPELESNYFG
ncbi:anthranilate synthase component I family protein [Psychroflexus planctonicus]|uniref:Para-aminobenzoate synthase n=1 Tax=Psychroflexus planctonicus TaxID=1526575 RepID=A0ABQ1SH64_9FLAO|nr:anthranilate synthase component I family protein [Psychroflexus planctonicus]GGE39260.1 para-aminobenzoate synthase [Psychroflexus planctonicus]